MTIKLTRVQPGYYSWNSSDYRVSASVIKEKGELLWTVCARKNDGKETGWQKLSNAENLKEARSIIETFEKEN